MIWLAFLAAISLGIVNWRYPASHRAWIVDSVVRIIGMAVLTTWVLTDKSFRPATSMLPILAYSWLTLPSSIWMRSGWPEYCNAWNAADRSSQGRPDTRAFPIVLPYGVGAILGAPVLATTTWLFTNHLRLLAANAPFDLSASLNPPLYGSYVISALMVVLGVVVVRVGPKKNPFYPAQQAYLQALTKGPAEKTTLMREAVTLTPDMPQPSTWIR